MIITGYFNSNSDHVIPIEISGEDFLWFQVTDKNGRIFDCACAGKLIPVFSSMVGDKFWNVCVLKFGGEYIDWNSSRVFKVSGAWTNQLYADFMLTFDNDTIDTW